MSAALSLFFLSSSLFPLLFLFSLFLTLLLACASKAAAAASSVISSPLLTAGSLTAFAQTGQTRTRVDSGPHPACDLCSKQ